MNSFNFWPFKRKPKLVRIGGAILSRKDLLNITRLTYPEDTIVKITTVHDYIQTEHTFTFEDKASATRFRLIICAYLKEAGVLHEFV